MDVTRIVVTMTGPGDASTTRRAGWSLRSLGGRPTCPVCPGRGRFDLVHVASEEIPGIRRTREHDWRCRRCGAVVRHSA